MHKILVRDQFNYLVDICFCCPEFSENVLVCLADLCSHFIDLCLLLICDGKAVVRHMLTHNNHSLDIFQYRILILLAVCIVMLLFFCSG